jgi:mono/diheme cytochrome c family protein
MIKPLYKRAGKAVAAVLTGAFILIQFVPSSFDRTAQPVTGEPAWDSPETRTTFYSVCGDCHSNQTVYPWYSRIAPGSWLIEQDIRKGRKHFNVSEWDRSQRGGDDAADEVRKGSMPVGPYLLMHPGANLSAAEKKRFVEGLHKTFGSTPDSTEYNSYESENNE